MALKDFFKKKDSKDTEIDDGIVVLKQTKPYECGGTDATRDTKAPKEIVSQEMVLFEVKSRFSPVYMASMTSANDKDKEILSADRLEYINAFAAPDGENTFLFLQKTVLANGLVNDCSWALVKENLMPSLTKLVRENELAKHNGYHSRTHGLPQDFGGSVNILYASGEKISFSNNQAPIIKSETGAEIAKLFMKAMDGEKAELPDVEKLKEIQFEEIRKDEGFTRAQLIFNEDGTGTNKKQSRYDDPTVYESEKPVEKEVIEAIKKHIRDTGLFAWADLPKSTYSFNQEKKLTFIFEDGTSVKIPGDRVVPDNFSRGFFNIELEMVTKH